MRKALFAGAVFTLAAAHPAIAITRDEESINTENVDDIDVHQEVETLASLKQETDALFTVSKEQLDAYEQALLDSYKSDLRLTAKHVTFGSRMILQEERLLYASRSVGSPSTNGYGTNLLTPSAITASELDGFLDETYMSGLGKDFVQAELNTGVNALFLVSLAIHESSWGKSRIARDKNNLFGYGAYDASPYQSAVTFGSKGEGITFVAQKLKENYLLSSGKYYAGPTLAGVNKRYSSDKKWGNKIAATMNQIDASVLTTQDIAYEVIYE